MRCAPVFAAAVWMASAAAADVCETKLRPHEGETVALSNAASSIIVDTLGGRIVSWKRNGSELLWMPEAWMDGRWNHGGIPVCWPWHGRIGDELPIHGYAWAKKFRTVSRREAAGFSVLEMECEHGELSLRCRIELSDGLAVELVTKNNGTRPVKVVSAIHPYFLVGDISSVSVNGRFFSEKFDRGFDCSQGDVYTIADGMLDRRIEVCAEKARRFVVWTPWTNLESKDDGKVAPLKAMDYRRFIAVEPVSESWKKAGTVDPGGIHEYRARILVSNR